MVRVSMVSKNNLSDFFKTLLLKVLASLTATLVIWLMKMFVSVIG